MNYRANRTCIYASRDRLGSPNGMRSTTQNKLFYAKVQPIVYKMQIL